MRQNTVIYLEADGPWLVREVIRVCHGGVVRGLRDAPGLLVNRLRDERFHAALHLLPHALLGLALDEFDVILQESPNLRKNVSGFTNRTVT
jgi:hypothetical protein